MRNHNRYMKMQTLECPRLGCGFKFVPGVNIGQDDKNSLPCIVVSKNGNACPGCPTHKVALQLRAMKMKIA